MTAHLAMMSERVDGLRAGASNSVLAAFESGPGLGVYQGTSSSGRESLLMTAKPKDLCSILYADAVTDGGVEDLLPPEMAPFSGRWLERGRVFSSCVSATIFRSTSR